MESKEEKYEWIEKYLNDELSETDRKAFEAKIALDEELKQELQLHKDITLTLGDKDLNLFKKKLKLAEQSYFEEDLSPPSSQKRAWLSQWAIAASIVLISGIAFFYLTFTPTAPEKLYTQYFSLAPSNNQVRGNTTSNLETAFSYYNQKNYQKALPFFEKEGANPQALFFAGNLYLYNQQTDKAIIAFQKVLQQADNLYLNKAQWYLGLAYLQKGNKTDAKKIFTEILQQQTPYAAKAQEILNKMN